MEKINIAELLKDCPKGMELYSPLCGDCKLYDVNDYTIRIETPNKDTLISLYHDGRYCINGEIMLFPKGKTTWEGFQKPFEDGDVIFTHANCLKVGLGNTWISIFQEKRNGGVATYVDMTEDGEDYYDYIDGDKGLLCMNEDIMRQRFATEEEKAKLFQAIKDNGYKWNAETKTLENLIEPKFKVGDRIKLNNCSSIYTITDLLEDKYRATVHSYDLYEIKFERQDAYQLVPNKFDINTLVPFESRVLVRGDKSSYWKPAIFGCYIKDMIIPYYALGGTCWRYCIPYEGNEHLLGTSNDCDEFYKTTWK